MKKNKPLNEKQILKGVAIGFVVAVVLSFLHPKPLPLITGIVFGVALSLLNFRLLYIALNKAVQLPPAKAQAYTSTRYILRYVITGVCIFVSIQAPHINVLGTIIGLILLKITILINNVFNSGGLLKEAFITRRH